MGTEGGMALGSEDNRSDLGSDPSRRRSSMLGGLLAAVPMLAVTRGILGPHHVQPPRLVTAGVIERIAPGWNPRQVPTVLWLPAHLLFGASVAAGYPRYRGARPASIASGCRFGLVVFLACYAGWLPALRILPPPQRLPSRQVGALIAGHLLWGGLIGWFSRRRTDRARRIPAPPEPGSVPSVSSRRR